MGRVILVRHGQASLGSDDYDRLSPVGIEQGEHLGEHWRHGGQRFAAVYRGTLRRHRETLDAITRRLPELPAAQEHAGLNEYDADALLCALRAGTVAPPRDAAQVKAHFRDLRQALLRWMDGTIEPAGMPSYAAFRDGVVAALAQARDAAARGDVLVVSSGGPIAVAAATVLGAPAATAVALNMRLANTAMVELVTTSRGFEVEAFNVQPHLLAASRLATRV
jgi:broad specificity phosphatase PhoE